MRVREFKGFLITKSSIRSLRFGSEEPALRTRSYFIKPTAFK
jgi:hypothetical protein